MWVGIAVTIALLLISSAACAQAEKRVALLIGNQSYSARSSPSGLDPAGQFAQRFNLFDADIAGYSRDRGRGGRENF